VNGWNRERDMKNMHWPFLLSGTSNKCGRPFSDDLFLCVRLYDYYYSIQQQTKQKKQSKQTQQREARQRNQEKNTKKTNKPTKKKQTQPTRTKQNKEMTKQPNKKQ